MPITFTPDEELNEVLNVVYRSAVEDTLAKIPRFILHMLSSTQETVQMNIDFYKRNPDLFEYREQIAKAYARLQRQSPDLDNLSILEKAGAAVRQSMQLKEDIHGKTAVKNNPGQNDPGAAGMYRSDPVPHRPAPGKGRPGNLEQRPAFEGTEIVIGN